jgi:type IV pili sensor histidine kinase/response regulator
MKLKFLLLFLLVTGCSHTTTKEKDIVDSKKATKVTGAPTEKHEKHKKKSNTKNSKEQLTTPNVVVQTGRYTVVAAKATPTQTQPLDVIIHVRLPNNLKTVGQSFRYLLHRSGYRLVNRNLFPTGVSHLFSKRIPAVHRRLGPISLKEALNVIVTPCFKVTEYLAIREINFVSTQLCRS